MLPLTVTLDDHAGTEKIASLPGPLSKRGLPSGTEARVGDMAYYAPWGNLAIFCRDFGHSDGLSTLGKTHDPLDALIEAANGATITISAPAEAPGIYS